MNTGIRVTALGPLRVWRGAQEILLGSPQQKAVFAALALRNGAALSLPELIHSLWGFDAPASAPGVTRTYISRLRATLDATLVGPAGSAIRSSAQGYSVHLEPGNLDVDVFDRLARDAETSRSDGDFDRAVDLLREALALWDGDPLPGIPGPDAERHRTRLQQAHYSVLIARLEADLDVGRYQQAVPELQTLVTDDPFNERLRELLMLALYRSGRQSEALGVYRDSYLLLNRELGIDPGPALGELHDQILRADPALRIETPPVAIASIPAQLPAAPALFVGRADILGRAMTLLPAPGDDHSSVVGLIGGMAGTGKTTLALHWAHQVADRFEDGQLYADLRGFDPAREPSDAAEVLEQFLLALGMTASAMPTDLDARAGALRTLLSGRRMLMVLDNARDFEQVKPLLPGTSGCLVIVTSRNTLSGLLAATGAQYLHLGLLDGPEAYEFLIGRLGPARVGAEPEAVRAIVQHCGRLPLALAIVAARANLHPDFALADIAAQLQAASGSLEGFVGVDPAADVRAVFSWSYRALNPTAARAFRLLALHPGPDFGIAGVTALLGANRPQAHRALSELTAARLVIEQAPGRYVTHDLVHAYADELVLDAESADERRAAVGRVLDHYLRTATDCVLLVTNKSRLPGPTPAVPVRVENPRDAVAWFTAEHPVLVAAIELAWAEGFDRHAWQLEWTVREYLNRQGLWHHLVVVQRIAVAAAERLDDRRTRAHVARGLALMDANMGRFTRAHDRLLGAIETFEATGDDIFQAEARLQLAWLLDQQGDFAGALECDGHVLKIHRDRGDVARLGPALSAASYFCTELGRYPEALALAEEGVSAIDRFGTYARADTWHVYGYVLQELGRYPEAIAAYQRALGLYRDLGLRPMEAETLRSLVDTYRAVGSPERARQAHAETLIALDGVEHPLAQRVRAKLESATADPDQLSSRTK
jgi:DNA-binding SARP family transcriptional activator